MWKRVSMIWLVVKGDAKRLWYALGHPQAPGWLKAGAALVLLYLVSPIDLIPGRGSDLRRGRRPGDRADGHSLAAQPVAGEHPRAC